MFHLERTAVDVPAAGQFAKTPSSKALMALPAPSAGPPGGVSLVAAPATTESLLVVDPAGFVVFATWDLSAILGYPYKKLLKMKLDALLPAPFNSMHHKWVPTSAIQRPSLSTTRNVQPAVQGTTL